MNKPNSYDETKVGGTYIPVNTGAHYCVIKQVSETKTKTGKDMIVVLFDFDKKDEQEGYFLDEFKFNDREEKKWPYQGTKYIMVNDYADPNKVSKDFKAFCARTEASNKGFTISWGDNWGKQFVNKRIGAVYGLVESEFNDKTYVRPECRWFCEYDNVPNERTPDPKYLKKKAAPAAPAVVDDMDELPF